ncbi:MAG: hypothetical protein ABJG88_05935 [Litorimonas sp.]
MKFCLFSIIFISAILAISAFFVSGLVWGYFPSSAIGVAFYEHTYLLVFVHVLVGLVAICCWPYHDNRKILVAVGITFFSSVFIHLGSKSYHSEKEMNVEIGSFSYRISSLELPTVDFPHPYGPSPLKSNSRAEGPKETNQSLYYSPKKQYGYSLALNVDERDRFFLAIHSAGIDQIDKFENSILISEEGRTLELYPAKPFTDAQAINIFQKFVNENLSDIRKDIDFKPVSASQ